ncbi:MAG: DUF444 family protein, partial [Bdellovibrionales bacterium]|nr:DUF444 family protein [Bdellovibrionales bacterium]
IALEMSDEIAKKVPLTKSSIVQTLYVMAKIMKKSVSIESTFKLKEEIPLTEEELQTNATAASMSGIPVKPKIKLRKIRVRTTVSPSGEVTAERVSRNGSIDAADLQLSPWLVAEKKGVRIEYTPDAKYTEELKSVLKTFQDDLNLANTDIKTLLPKSTLETFESTVTNIVHGVSPQLMLSVPTVPHAIEAYSQAVKSRAMKALQLAVLGQRGVSHNFHNVSLKVLPDIPYFEFDKSTASLVQQNLPVPRADNYKREALSLALSSVPMDAAATRPKSVNSIDVRPISGEPGRKFWGPKPSSNGGGEGDGKGSPSDKPGQPGDKPSNGTEPGDGGGDPTFAEIDLETYAEALSAHVSLPNLRPKDGESEMTEEERGDWAQSRRGPPKGTLIARKAFEKGLAYYRQNPENEDDVDDKAENSPNKKRRSARDIAKIYKKGFSLLDPAKDWYVETFTPAPAPQVNAQITLIMDLSGSYENHKLKTKQMFYDLRAILLKKYKSVEFRFVAFDGSAFAFENPDDFFKLNLGGSTSYSVGLQKTLEVQEEFPDSKYDRYVVLAGDMEDGNKPQVIELLDQLRLQSQFFASVKMNASSRRQNSTIENALIELAESDDFVSFVDLSVEGNKYSPIVLRRLFKNKD